MLTVLNVALFVAVVSPVLGASIYCAATAPEPRSAPCRCIVCRREVAKRACSVPAPIRVVFPVVFDNADAKSVEPVRLSA